MDTLILFYFQIEIGHLWEMANFGIDALGCSKQHKPERGAPIFVQSVISPQTFNTE